MRFDTATCAENTPTATQKTVEATPVITLKTQADSPFAHAAVPAAGGVQVPATVTSSSLSPAKPVSVSTPFQTAVGSSPPDAATPTANENIERMLNEADWDSQCGLRAFAAALPPRARAAMAGCPLPLSRAILLPRSHTVLIARITRKALARLQIEAFASSLSPAPISAAAVVGTAAAGGSGAGATIGADAAAAFGLDLGCLDDGGGCGAGLGRVGAASRAQRERIRRGVLAAFAQYYVLSGRSALTVIITSAQTREDADALAVAGMGALLPAALKLSRLRDAGVLRGGDTVRIAAETTAKVLGRWGNSTSSETNTGRRGDAHSTVSSTHSAAITTQSNVGNTCWCRCPSPAASAATRSGIAKTNAALLHCPVALAELHRRHPGVCASCPDGELHDNGANCALTMRGRILVQTDMAVVSKWRYVPLWARASAHNETNNSARDASTTCAECGGGTQRRSALAAHTHLQVPCPNHCANERSSSTEQVGDNPASPHAAASANVNVTTSYPPRRGSVSGSSVGGGSSVMTAAGTAASSEVSSGFKSHYTPGLVPLDVLTSANIGGSTKHTAGASNNFAGFVSNVNNSSASDPNEMNFLAYARAVHVYDSAFIADAASASANALVGPLTPYQVNSERRGPLPATKGYNYLGNGVCFHESCRKAAAASLAARRAPRPAPVAAKSCLLLPKPVCISRDKHLDTCSRSHSGCKHSTTCTAYGCAHPRNALAPPHGHGHAQGSLTKPHVHPLGSRPPVYSRRRENNIDHTDASADDANPRSHLPSSSSAGRCTAMLAGQPRSQWFDSFFQSLADDAPTTLPWEPLSPTSKSARATTAERSKPTSSPVSSISSDSSEHTGNGDEQPVCSTSDCGHYCARTLPTVTPLHAQSLAETAHTLDLISRSRLALGAENGSFSRRGLRSWRREPAILEPLWRPECEVLMRFFAARVPGSRIGVQEASMIWDFALCQDQPFAESVARELEVTLRTGIAARLALRVEREFLAVRVGRGDSNRLYFDQRIIKDSEKAKGAMRMLIAATEVDQFEESEFFYRLGYATGVDHLAVAATTAPTESKTSSSTASGKVASSSSPVDETTINASPQVLDTTDFLQKPITIIHSAEGASSNAAAAASHKVSSESSPHLSPLPLPQQQSVFQTQALLHSQSSLRQGFAEIATAPIADIDDDVNSPAGSSQSPQADFLAVSDHGSKGRMQSLSRSSSCSQLSSRHPVSPPLGAVPAGTGAGAAALLTGVDSGAVTAMSHRSALFASLHAGAISNINAAAAATSAAASGSKQRSRGAAPAQGPTATTATAPTLAAAGVIPPYGLGGNATGMSVGPWHAGFQVEITSPLSYHSIQSRGSLGSLASFVSSGLSSTANAPSSNGMDMIHESSGDGSVGRAESGDDNDDDSAGPVSSVNATAATDNAKTQFSSISSSLTVPSESTSSGSYQTAVCSEP